MTDLAAVPRQRHRLLRRARSVSLVDVVSAIMIIAIYVAVVGGLGGAIGGDWASTLLAVTATALVAVGFQPFRRTVHRLVDRRLHGRRATPHEVLSEFNRRVAASDSLLERAARSLVEGTVSDRAAVSIDVGGRLIETAAWPRGAPSGDEVVSLPIVHAGVHLGALTLSVGSGQRLPEQDELLAQRLASSMGLAIANRVRTERLRARVDELRQSRRRVVAVLDDTRRRLERDLHDGAQQQLVALKVKLGLARAMSARDGAARTSALLDELTCAADVTVDAMRDFARGLHPPLLEAEGLGPAVEAQARRAPIPVTVEFDRVGRYDRPIETTVNLFIVEALRNVVRHARATAAHVSIVDVGDALSFGVSDDGIGFEVAASSRGGGLTNLADRIDSVAGHFSVDSTPGRGTTVSGTIPIREAVPS